MNIAHKFMIKIADSHSENLCADFIFHDRVDLNNAFEKVYKYIMESEKKFELNESIFKLTYKDSFGMNYSNIFSYCIYLNDIDEDKFAKITSHFASEFNLELKDSNEEKKIVKIKTVYK